MENDPARQQPTTPPNIPPVQAIDTLGHSNKKFIALVVVIVILLIVAVGEAYYLGTRKNNNATDNQAVPSTTINSPSVSSAPTQLPVTQTAQAPAPAEGYQEYRNEELGYGFYYLKTDSLNECQDSPCLSIDRITLRVQTLGTYETDMSDIKTSLLQADLYCSADGPTGSVRCENKSVDEFINPLGFKGYKITRTRISTAYINGASEETRYDDYAYVYVLPEVVKGQGLTDYAAIMFAVDTPLQENLKELTAIAETYFTF